MLSISVVDGVPLPPGEEFTGVIRTQDIRATEKDRVKIGDCFRGGDVIRGLVASQLKVLDNIIAYMWIDFSGRCAKLFHNNCKKRFGSDICNQ
jgi:hypothetical protein